MEYCEYDEDFGERCKTYMKGLRCYKGEYCEKIHKFPREDHIVCQDISSGYCPRTASDCWFLHPEERINFIPDENAPFSVQPMGELVRYLNKELVTNPNKYKTSENGRAASPQVLAKDSRLPVVGSQDNEVQPVAPSKVNPGFPTDSSVVNSDGPNY